MRRRLRAHAGLWTLVALLGVGMVLVSTSVGPVITRVEDHGLRQMVDAAPYTQRDLISTRPAASATEAAQMRSSLDAGLPPTLRDVVEVGWQYHFTPVVPGDGTGAALVGDGVTTSDYGLAPVVSVHHQVGLDDEVSVVDGAAPDNDPDTGLLEVMVAQAVAEGLGLEVGGEYVLYPGQLGMIRHPAAGDWVAAGALTPLDDMPDLTVRVTGVFIADDRSDPVWDHARLLDPGFVTLPIGDPPHPRAPRGALVTDEAGFAVLLDHDRASGMAPTAGVRLRLDTALLDSAWAQVAPDAVARAGTDPALSQVPVTTGLSGLLTEYHRGAAATRAVIAVVAAGVLATLVGLLVLAARLIMARRRAEVELLRARGGSLTSVTARLAAEALPVAVLAATAGWLLHRLALGEPPWSWPGVTSLPVVLGTAAAALVLLVVPVAGTLAGRQVGVVAAREDLGRRRAHPARLTIDVAVVVLAALGYLLVQQRGLAMQGVDPYLSAVPVLIAVAAGLVALRLYPWPVWALAAVARRLRGLVSFVGLARAGRAAPGAALALLVLAVAVTVGGFAGAVTAGVEDARQTGAVQSLGAHLRVSVDSIPDGTTEAVASLPGVETVVVTARGGAVREEPVRHGRALQRRDLQGAQVVVVDVTAYQELLDRLGVDVRLPDELLRATVDSDPVPVLAAPAIGGRNAPSVWVGDVERLVVPVGDVADLPGPDRGRSWVLVPQQAWPEPGMDGNAEVRSVTRVTGYELLVVGEDADPAAVRAAVAGLPEVGEVGVTSLSQVRSDLEDSGFNAGLTLVLVVGTLAAAVGAVLSVGLALVVQARARGRVLSLLRTMGLSSRQARGTLLVEVLPPVTLAVLVGAVTGAAMPVLLGASLGLEQFTGGVPVVFQVDPVAVAALAAVVLGLVVIGVVIESAVNRSLGLGRALRVE
jgi:putative ABC transport system permease protein